MDPSEGVKKSEDICAPFNAHQTVASAMEGSNS
jgi:hypothetical protein